MSAATSANVDRRNPIIIAIGGKYRLDTLINEKSNQQARDAIRCAEKRNECSRSLLIGLNPVVAKAAAITQNVST
jgi:hypothetical protein